MLSETDLKQIIFYPLSAKIDSGSFDCGDKDLNGFLRDDALGYQQDHLAFTTCLFHGDQFLAYYSVMADSLSLSTGEKRLFRENKHLREYPALKIARLACQKSLKNNRLGSLITKVVKGFAVTLNDQGIAIRFITVDAYPEAIGFYEKCGFTINRSETEKKTLPHSISMRFDLYAPV